MNSFLKNKVVFITGGSNGIGKSIVSLFCRNGAKVIFCDIDEDAGTRLCAELLAYECEFVAIDVSNAVALEQGLTGIIAKYGNVDILINNVGIGRFGSILDISVEDFEHVLHVNLRSVFLTAKTLVKHRAAHLKLNSYGRIINLASTRYLMSEPDSEAYAASKGGIVSLTHALALSLSKYNITVNCLSPGWIETGNYETLKESDHKQHPSGRVGMPEDIARTCLFLCDPNNNFINGQNIIIDGGMTKKMIYEE
ncbi:SDR family NAD(P)-dependent oxidoreductase [Massilibacteroides vaginae]|uniref:SDR family NAD(P)-dependent oxidoreductase n=1 Tax=Massilibacteroides vaginae TaxID=1673718 RepID=UPI000A1CEF31|nr:SDR family oxidoreductase [Massilibacteroides vaginae]